MAGTFLAARREQNVWRRMWTRALRVERDDPSPERLRELAAAYHAARARAEALAKVAGVRLGEVLSVRVVGG